MENNIVVKNDVQSIVKDISLSQELCEKLLKTPHYSKIGKDGIFAIVQKANSLGIHPIEALNGGMYYVQGKVEMSAILMAKLIRQKKHSISLDKASNESICILHGKRADNGDTWRASFSIKDAERAGLLKQGSPWTKYPDIMCYNRALSKLARQLFPDVIGNSYIEGEIQSIDQTDVQSEQVEECEVVETSIEEEKPTLTENQILVLDGMIGSDDDFRSKVLGFIEKKFGEASLSVVPVDMYTSIFDRIQSYVSKKQENEKVA